MVDREERDDEPRSVWAPRVLAPLAFFVAATILVLLIQSSLSANDDAPEQTSPPAATTEATGETEETTTEGATTTQPQQRRVYRVRSGDTLESIAARFNTDVETLLELNPEIDPLSLTVGQRLRVR